MESARTRLLVIMAIMLASVIMLTGRLFYIQIVAGNRYAEKSRDQAQQRMILHAKRGSLFDRNGTLLATTLNKPLDLQKQDSDSDKNSKGITRVYPYGSIGGTIVGYTGIDTYGQGGIELSADAALRGEDGWAIVMRDARNTRYRKADLPEKMPVNGANVYLSLDIALQEIVQKTLLQTIEQFAARGGMAMVMDPQTGEILAMADELGFNPNTPSRFSLANRRNRCISDIYEPGSTFKVITSATALMDNILKESDSINGDGGAYVVFNETIRDHKPYGMLSFTDALAFSSNVCFAKIANMVGNERLYRYAKNFGFGANSGLDLPGEEDGIVHPIKNWSGRTRVTMAIGQEVSVTFLQMMLAFSCVANDGVLRKPSIIRSVEYPAHQIIPTKRAAVRQVISPAVARRLRTMMVEVVARGTGKTADLPGVLVGGKTGTSQKIDAQTGAYSNSLFCSSFIGFAPIDKPALVCGVLIDEPLGGETGGMAAAPAFSKILHEIISRPTLGYAEKILNTSYDSVVAQTAHMSALAQRLPGINKMIKDTLGTSKPRGIDSLQSDTLGALAGVNKQIPNCVGIELRTAIDTLMHYGIKPCVNGFGLVVSQRPRPSRYNEATAACTLYCSMGG